MIKQTISFIKIKFKKLHKEIQNIYRDKEQDLTKD